MSINKPNRLQGTDGIRSAVQSSVPAGVSALSYYLDTANLTPEFFELYAYSFALLLQKEGLAQSGDSLCVGWDTRDTTGTFNEAALSGVRKAGLNVHVLGILPTPGIALFMLESEDKGALALTASHNPADQNGIKLFLGCTGLKFLPQDDLKLTSLLYELEGVDLSTLPLTGLRVEASEEADLCFRHTMLEPKNSWLTQEDFSDTILVVDASKGAAAHLVGPIFNRLGFDQIHLCNIEGAINSKSGVADIEGREWISEACYEASYQGFEAFELLFELARLPLVRGGQKNLVALIFDGDADRFFRLDYCPKRLSLRVSSGDRVGVHQASYLAGQGETGLFLHTVESDLMIGLKASDLGFDAKMTGVGDKWILTQAFLDLSNAQLTGEGKSSGLSDLFIENSDLNQLSAMMLSHGYQLACKRGWIDYQQKGSFQIGLEESGHAITPTLLPSGKTAFAGNGIKAALNDLVALYHQPDLIEAPYAEGLKRTTYAYFVEKSSLEPGQPFRTELEAQLLAWCTPLVEEGIQAVICPFLEESSMVFCSLEKDGVQVGALFARNSGTEDKTSIYLRGSLEQEEMLVGLMDRLHLQILVRMKNPNHPSVQVQRDLLTRILREPRPAFKPEEMDLLALMERKEGLLNRDSGSWRLTVKGMAFSDLM